MKLKSFADVRKRGARASARSRSVEPSPGFTLIELLVTVTVAGILASIAVPAFNNFVLNDRQVGQLNSLASSLNYARSEAIKRNLAGGITVCPSVNAATCSGSNWRGRWIVTDSDPVDPPMQTVPALAGGDHHGHRLRPARRSVCSRARGELHRASGLIVRARRVGLRGGSGVPPMRRRALIDPAARERGFTLIEVMVSLVVLSIGLLGIGKLVLFSARANDSAYLRGQATEMAYEILDNMRGNGETAMQQGHDTALAPLPSNPDSCTA